MNALFGLFAGPFCYLCFVYACHILLSVPSSLLATLERTDLLALLYVIFPVRFIAFPYGFLGQVWHLSYRFLIIAFFFTKMNILVSVMLA